MPKIMISGHGDDVYAHKQKIHSNFSSNVYNQFDTELLDNYIRSAIPGIHSYPEPDASSLALELAKRSQVSEQNICVTNGAAEAIYLIAQALKSKKADIVIPAFSEYEDACKANSIELNFITEPQQISPTCNMVWLCNPNNPTGKVWDENRLWEIIDSKPETIFIIDRSYSFFTTQPLVNDAEAIQHKNVMLIHSLTKQFAVPGMRIGYIVACTEMMAILEPYRIPWRVNSLAIEAGKYLLRNENRFSRDRLIYLNSAQHFFAQLKEIPKLSVIDSDTHFCLCRLHIKQAAELKRYLIEQHGILIRDAANFRGLDANFFRVAAQSETENRNLIKAIKAWIQ